MKQAVGTGVMTSYTTRSDADEIKQESPAVADKPVRRFWNDCTVAVRVYPHSFSRCSPPNVRNRAKFQENSNL